MGITFEDKSGELPTADDADEAILAVQTAMVRGILKLPPELAVQLPNIHRCLVVARMALREES